MNSGKNSFKGYALLPRLRRIGRSFAAEKNYKLLISILGLSELTKAAINK